jgi:hypothetical protein
MLQETLPVWAKCDRNEVVEFLRKLIPLLISGLRTRREAMHEYALLLSALTDLNLTLSQVVIPLSSHPSFPNLELHLANMCRVLDRIVQTQLQDISEKIRHDPNMDVTAYLHLLPAESGDDLDKIDSLTKSLERCGRRKQSVMYSTSQHSQPNAEPECRDHWRTLYNHLSRFLIQRSCTEAHEVKILLYHVYRGEPVVGLLMSNCVMDKWYPLYCDLKVDM